MNQNITRIAIFTMAIVYIFFIPVEPTGVSILFKIIPICLIIYYGWQQSPIKRHVTHYLIFIGLLFSMIGDATLHWFIIGLSAFLIGHLFYIYAFIKRFQNSRRSIRSLIPLILFSSYIGFQLVTALYQSENDMLIVPVIVYIVAIMFMCFFAIMTKNRWAIIGSILFVISDSILAWNKFVTPIYYSEILIMTTYYAAQFFIAHCLASIGFTKRSI